MANKQETMKANLEYTREKIDVLVEQIKVLEQKYKEVSNNAIFEPLLKDKQKMTILLTMNIY